MTGLLDPLDSSAVEAMIAEGRRVVESAISEFRPDAIIAGFSGGDDSIVSTHFAVEQFAALPVHCDTSVGVRRTREHVDYSAARLGWDLRVSHASVAGCPAHHRPGGGRLEPFDPASLPAGRWTDGATAYEEYCLNYGFPGRALHHQMYQRLKERPLLKVARELRSGRGRKVLVITGIRHDESGVRAGYKRAIQAPAKTFWVWANPFYWRTALDFEAYRQEFGLPRNPVKPRLGISGECLCGSYSAPGERQAIRAVEPETADYLDALESRVRDNGFPWGWGESPPQWWIELRRGQSFLPGFDSSPPPMCVGCARRTAS